MLDIERQHAVWQWALTRRRAMKLMSMNAWLKLDPYLRCHDNLPPAAELQPYPANIKAGERLAMADVRGDGAIAPGLRHEWDGSETGIWGPLSLHTKAVL